MNRNVYTSIDIAKLCFAVGIVILHTSAYTVLPSVLPFVVEKGFLRLAVPFFFVVSGFFLGERMRAGEVKKVILQYVKRLLLPFIVFGTINTVLEIVKMSMNATQGIAGIVLKHVLFYPYGALWYVSASIVGALLLWPFIKSGKLNLGLMVGGCLYTFALLCNNYYFVAQWVGLQHIIDRYLDIFISARNGFFVGFFMLGIGVKLSFVNVGRCKAGRIGWTVALWFLYMLEALSIRQLPAVDDKAYYILQLVLVPSIVLTLMALPLPVSKRTSKLCRGLSTSIYFQHRMWISLLTLCGLRNHAVILAGLTLLLCVIVYAVVRASKNSVLVRLLN